MQRGTDARGRAGIPARDVSEPGWTDSNGGRDASKGGRIRSKGGRHASTAGGTKLDTLSQADGVRTAWLNLALGTHTVLGLHAGGEEAEGRAQEQSGGFRRRDGAWEQYIHSPVGGREGRKEGGERRVRRVGGRGAFFRERKSA